MARIGYETGSGRVLWARAVRPGCLAAAYAVFAVLLRVLPAGPQRYPFLFVPMETFAVLAGSFYGAGPGTIIAAMPLLLNPLVSRIIKANPVPIDFFEFVSYLFFGFSGWAAGYIAGLRRAAARRLFVCASCRRVRDEKSGAWRPIEAYLAASFRGMEFSHGCCPECMGRLYPEVVDPQR